MLSKKLLPHARFNPTRNYLHSDSNERILLDEDNRRNYSMNSTTMRYQNQSFSSPPHGPPHVTFDKKQHKQHQSYDRSFLLNENSFVRDSSYLAGTPSNQPIGDRRSTRLHRFNKSTDFNREEDNDGDSSMDPSILQEKSLNYHRNFHQQNRNLFFQKGKLHFILLLIY
jgi:hypothetical protein